MDDVTFLVTTTAAVVTGYCLWVRRGSWGQPWELGSSITVAGMFTCLLFMAPTWWAQLLSTPLHFLTGVWNVDDLFGHLAYLTALIALVKTLVNRIDLAEPERFTRKCLELPIAIMLPLLLGLFYAAAPREHARDLFAAPATLWLNLYWVVLCACASYLITLLWRLLLVVRRDPRSRITANVYLAAIMVDSGCVVSIIVSRMVPDYPHVVTWLLLCVAASGYALAPAYSWRQKTKRPAMEPGPDPQPVER
jgi:hypothetical protein